MQVKHDASKYTFILLDDADQEIGYLSYRLGSEGELRATHTKVDPRHEGKGYAGLLLDALVAYAQSQNLKIVPVCSYVVRAFDKNPDRYASVIK